MMHFILDENRGSKLNNTKEKLENHIKYTGHKDITTQYGRLIEKQLIVNDVERQYVLQVPTHNNKIGLLIFYHGSRGTAWMSALEYTRFIEIAEKENLLIVFGQAGGIQEYPHEHEHYKGHITHGELYFEIRDITNGFQNDLKYTVMLIQDIKNNYNIDDGRIYFVGHSNGGVFGCLLPIYMPNTFNAIISHMGGIGHDPHFYLNFSKLKVSDNKTKILFYTGETDVHRFPCEVARELFLAEDFPIVDIHIVDGLDHTYSYLCEGFILDWINGVVENKT